MNMKEIGRSKILVPPVGMGTWAIGGGSWWGNNDDSLSIKTIEMALDYGIRWIDTAPIYGLHHSEEVVGKALLHHRDQVILSTKCGLQWDEAKGSYHKTVDGREVYRDLSTSGIRKGLEGSLKRLRTDYIDILFTHWQSEGPNRVPVEETMETLMQLKKEGKIRAIGASNVTKDHILAYESSGSLDVIQEKYSMLDRHIEKDLLPLCEAHQISLQAYSPLEQGLLSGRLTMERQFPKGDVRHNKPLYAPQNRRMILDMLQTLTPLLTRYSCSISNLILAWTVAQSNTMHVLCGARTPVQIQDNAGALAVVLTPEDLAFLNEKAASLIQALSLS